MIDYNQDYESGDYENGVLNVVVEIPFGSTEKIEWSRTNMEMEVNRREPSTFPEPVNYGFIPKTTGGDGDNLDAIIISTSSIPTGSVIKSRIIGVMRFIDGGEVDDKIITVPVNETKAIDQILSINKDEIEFYFNHYKDYLHPGITRVLGWSNVDDAKATIFDSIKSWRNQNS